MSPPFVISTESINQIKYCFNFFEDDFFKLGLAVEWVEPTNIDFFRINLCENIDLNLRTEQKRHTPSLEFARSAYKLIVPPEIGMLILMPV